MVPLATGSAPSVRLPEVSWCVESRGQSQWAPRQNRKRAAPRHASAPQPRPSPYAPMARPLSPSGSKPGLLLAQSRAIALGPRAQPPFIERSPPEGVAPGDDPAAPRADISPGLGFAAWVPALASYRALPGPIGVRAAAGRRKGLNMTNRVSGADRSRGR